ncbi:MAG: hypothetical protein FWF44_10650 [Defluviitaleaceae bacterium]|nr:hypothetical protein [Defluviitaleaceae bacterium]
MTTEQQTVALSDAQAADLARALIQCQGGIKAYIEAHRAAYEEFLRQRREAAQ